MYQDNPNYEDNFLGCLVGLALGEAPGAPLRFKARQQILEESSLPATSISGGDGKITRSALALAESLVATGGKLDKWDLQLRLQQILEKSDINILKPEPVEESTVSIISDPDNGAAGRIAPLGLLFAYGRFDRERFLLNCEVVTKLTHRHPNSLHGAVAVAIAIRQLCRNELLPEDLMSAALDFLPFGLLDELPLRKKLLAAQDYLEERQTLVDNIEAGELLDVDLRRVDLKNVERCGLSSDVSETVAGAFYAFTSYKQDFEGALTLALETGGDTSTRAALVGALSGAYLGLKAIPERWRSVLAQYAEVVEVAQRLHKTARSRELTDYVDTGI
jgi:ADP-ribosylglycohydrolase